MGHLWGVLIPRQPDESLPRRVGDDVRDAVRFTSAVNRALGTIPGRRLIVVLTERAPERFHTQAQRLGAIVVAQPPERGPVPVLADALAHALEREARPTMIVLPETALDAWPGRLAPSLAKAAWGVRTQPDLIVMLGAHPSGPVARQAWVLPGPPIAGLEDLEIRSVKRFVPCASAEAARNLYGHDALTATRMLVGTAERLVEFEPRASTVVATPWSDLSPVVSTRDDRLAVLALPDALPSSQGLRCPTRRAPVALAAA